MSARRPHILVLASPNQSRLEHFRKLGALRDRYEISCAYIGAGLGWERKFVDHLVEIPEAARFEAGVEIVRALERRPDGIINISEAYVPLHTELAEHYALRGPRVEVLSKVRNKIRMRELCGKLGIPIPRFLGVTAGRLAVCQDLTFPVVIKPAIGCSSTLVQRIDSYSELAASFPAVCAAAREFYTRELMLPHALREFGDFPFVVEELVGGSMQFPFAFPYPVGEISVESVCFGGEVTVLAIHDSPVASNGPFYEKLVNSTPTRLPAMLVARATEYVSRIHAALGDAASVLHTELRTFSNDLVLLEFGARIGGSSLYRSVLNSTGNDFLEILIQLSLGQRPTLSTALPQPTLTHYLQPPAAGRICAMRGMTWLTASPYYVEHQLYDNVGDSVGRPPLKTRASGYVTLRGPSYEPLEKEMFEILRRFAIEVEPIS